MSNSGTTAARGPAVAVRSATSGGLKPPEEIAWASSSLSFRSPWLSLGSCPGRATVRPSPISLPRVFKRSIKAATSVLLSRSGKAASSRAREMADCRGCAS